MNSNNNLLEGNKPYWLFNLFVFLLSLILVFFIYKDYYLSLIETWYRSDTFSHCVIIPFISAYLIWTNRDYFKFEQIKFSVLGLLLLLVAVVSCELASRLDINFLLHITIVWIIPVLFLLSFGLNLFMAFLFPLAYLTFAAPFGEWLIPYLIDITAWFVVNALELLNIPVYREGRYFQLTSGNYEVAKACSGIRYTIATLAVGTLFSYLIYTKTNKRIIFVLICFIVPIIANGLRALFIVLLAHHTNKQLAVGVDHFIYGWVFFGFTILILFYFGNKFSDDRTAIKQSYEKVVRYSSRTDLQKLAFLFSTLCILLFAYHIRSYVLN